MYFTIPSQSLDNFILNRYMCVQNLLKIDHIMTRIYEINASLQHEYIVAMKKKGIKTL